MTSEQSIKDKAMECLKSGNFTEAIEKYNKIIMSNKMDVDDLNCLGFSYFKSGDFARARVVFAEINKIFPEHKASRVNLAESINAFTIKQNLSPDKQIAELESALCYDPTNFNIIYNLTKLYMNVDNLLKASFFGQLSVMLNPKNADAKIQLGKIYNLQSKWNSAITEFNDVLKEHPDNTIAKECIQESEKYINEFNELHKNGIEINIGILMLLSKSIQEVYNGVFIGSQSAAGDLEELHKNGITHILNVTTEVPCYFENPQDTKDKFIYHRENAIDSLDCDIVDSGIIDRSLDFIDNALAKNGKVLVHCQAGISRSGSVVVAYLMKKLKLSYSDALIKARSVRGCINPNASFEKQIKEHIKVQPQVSEVLDTCGEIFKTATIPENRQVKDNKSVKSIFEELYKSDLVRIPHLNVI